MNPHDMVRPWCVVCGKKATNRHHEPPKGIAGIGSKGTEPPVLSLCGSGTTRCHGMRHAGKLKFRFKGGWQWQVCRNGAWTDWVPTINEVEDLWL